MHVFHRDLGKDRKADPGDVIVNGVRTELFKHEGVLTRLARSELISTYGLDLAHLNSTYTAEPLLATPRQAHDHLSHSVPDRQLAGWLSLGQLITWGASSTLSPCSWTPVERELGLTRAQSSLAFSLALLAEGERHSDPVAQPTSSTCSPRKRNSPSRNRARCVDS